MNYYDRKIVDNKRKGYASLWDAQRQAERFLLHSLYIIPRNREKVKLGLEKIYGKYLSTVKSISNRELNVLVRNSLTQYDSIARKTTYAKGDRRSGEIYHLYKTIVLDNALNNKVVNIVLNRDEYYKKHLHLNSIISWNRWNVKLGTYTPFFICNTVKNCAKDHQDYEGKMYYDKEFKKFLKGSPLYDKALSFIKSRKLLSIQYITQNRPWLTTRRNCRHTFHPIDISTVLSFSNKEIIQKYDLSLKQLKPLTYEQRMYNMYRTKLEELSAIQKELDCKELRRDIARTKALLRTWANKL